MYYQDLKLNVDIWASLTVVVHFVKWRYEMTGVDDGIAMNWGIEQEEQMCSSQIKVPAVCCLAVTVKSAQALGGYCMQASEPTIPLTAVKLL